MSKLGFEPQISGCTHRRLNQLYHRDTSYVLSSKKCKIVLHWIKIRRKKREDGERETERERRSERDGERETERERDGERKRMGRSRERTKS